MEFEPESGQMKCGSCGHRQALEAQGRVQSHSLTEILKAEGEYFKPLGEQALQVQCGGCGGIVVFAPPEVAGICSFCGAAIVAQPKAADPLIAPDGVLPALIPKKKAQEQVRQWLGTRWFAPNALKRIAQPEGIGGVYLPFWTYDCDTNSSYSGERGEHYYDTEFYTETDSQGNTVQRTREVQHTRWYSASGAVSRGFIDVLIPATRAVPEARLNKLQPWDLPALCPYEPGYLAGFKAQRYQVEPAAGFAEAQGLMRSAIERDVRRDIGGDEQRIDNIDTTYSNVMFRHLLLPVWIGAYRFQNKVYHVVVNARTNEVQGERPYSVWKIAMLAVLVLFLVWLFVFLQAQNSTRTGGKDHDHHGGNVAASGENGRPGKGAEPSHSQTSDLLTS